MDGGEQVVDQLGARAVARPHADVKTPRRQRLQHGRRLRQRRGLAGQHQAHRAVARALRAAGHRRVDRREAPRRQRRGAVGDILGRDRRAQQHGAAGGEPGRDAAVAGGGPAVGAEQHRARLRGIDDDDDDQVAGRRQRLRVGRDGDPGAARQRLARRVDVVHREREAGLVQALRERPAHRADAHDADVLHAHDGISRRLRETDIRMPSPSPSVTIAVPP